VLVRTALAGGPYQESQIAMIGDRAEDIIAAREKRIFSAAAAWGYGTSEEIADAKPDRIFHTMSDYALWIESGSAAINQNA
jgi:phosphoglycolate phosphatase